MAMTSEKFRVRQLEEKDIDQWAKLRQHLWDGLSDEENSVKMTGNYEHSDTQLALVSESSEGNLIGFLEASVRPFVEDCHSENVGYLEGWWIEPDYRRNGIGRNLVSAAEQWARGKGCEEMASDSELGNDLSLEAHLRLGYEETSRLVHLRKELG
jgi:aminoglycoside 6'-N-acetyltransferase I